MASFPDNAPNDSTTARSRWARAISGADGGDAREALRELAGSYWYCVYAWWRRSGLDAASAATATVAAFTRWLGEAPPTAADSGAARMREWLPARLAELPAQGVKATVPVGMAIERAWAAQRFADEPAGEPDTIFQRRWALTILEFSTTTLQAEYAACGEHTLFNELLPFAGFEPSDETRYAEAAARTGRTSGAMRKAVFDFRTRQREVLRDYVGDTVADPADLESEMTALLCACEAAGAQMTPLPGHESSPTAAGDAALPTVIRALRPDEVFARAMQSVRMTSGGPGGWTPPTIAEAARLFAQYEVLALLGRGGMGAVYQARQIELDRLVAIKLLPLEVSVDRDFADRFRREARAMAKLNHPNIISVYDFGTTPEGHLFFVMEFVEGANLSDVIHLKRGDAGELTLEQTLEIVSSVCDALAYAHGKGIIHRDIKPANVMLSTESKVKVADFGLARLTDAAPESICMTQTGMVMGTPDYMAPEQMKGVHVDHRADIYSVGVMLYEMLCREVPKGAFERPSERIGCDPRIDQLVLKAMQQSPERRFQSTTEMKTAVDAARTTVPAVGPLHVEPAPPPGGKKSRAPLFIGLGAAAVAVCAALLVRSRPQPVSAEKPPAVEPPAVTASAAATPAPAVTPVPTTPVGVTSAVPTKATPGAIPKPVTPPPLQPGEVLAFAGHRYQLIPDEADWDAAKAKAEAMGGHLATFVTEEEEVWARDHLIAPLKVDEQRRYAIGGYAEENAKDPRWLNGATVGKLKWVSGNPGWRGSQDTDEKKAAAGLYAVRLKDGNRTWIGILPTKTALAGFIVEWDDGKPDPAPATPAPIVATAPPAPAPATPLPKPQSEVEKWLAQVDGPQQEAFRKQVSEPFETAMAELRKQHLAGLDAGFARATTTKQLTEAIAWQKERKTFEETRTVAGSDTGLPSGVQSLRAAFRKQAAKLEQERTAKAKVLHAAYEAILLQNQDALTQRQRLEDALLLQNKREEIAQAWLVAGAAAASNVAAPRPVGAAAAAATPPAAMVASPAPIQTGSAQNSFTLAETKRPFVNTLGMKFVPVPIAGRTTGQKVLFCIWETRVQDYEAFAKDPERVWPKPTFKQTPTDPAVNVSWQDANAFCDWLTQRERRVGLIRATERYRLPTDLEWSAAIGSRTHEDPKNKTPIARSGRVPEFPWGTDWPPPRGSGNYSGEECSAAAEVLKGYSDGFLTTAPVGSFKPNRLGLFDLGGNVWELCEDLENPIVPAQRITRGASYSTCEKGPIWWSARERLAETDRNPSIGFRVVLAADR